MAIIVNILEEEFERFKEMEQIYIQKIKSLPKGSLKIKKVSDKEYYYLLYRDGEKIKTDYIKISSTEELEQFKKKIAQRKKLEKELKELKKDCNLIRKVIKK